MAGAASVFLVVDRCLRGFGFIEPPVGVKLTLIFSPGTLISQSLSPTFLARIEIAGRAAGGFGLGVGGVKSPIIIVTAV